MHIPDDILYISVWQAATLIASLALAANIRMAISTPAPGSYLRTTIVTIGIFLVQMFTLPGHALLPTHLIGGLAAVMLVGAPTAAVIMASVILVQTLVFGDGGVTSLGANFLNMGLVAIYTGSILFDVIRQLGRDRLWSSLAAFVAGCASATACFLVAGVETGIGKPVGIVSSVTAMLSGSAWAILIEGIFACAVYLYLSFFKPGLLDHN